MTSAASRSVRLLSALEDLVSAEAASCAAGDFAGVIALQERAEPLVAHLVAAAPWLTDRALRERIAALVERRSATAALLGERLAQLGAELAQTHTAQRRVARVAPVYGKPRTAGTVSGQLLAVG